MAKRERGRIQGVPNFFGYPYYLRNGESYGFQILHAHLWAQSEQKPIKNSGKVAVGVVRASIHRAHRAVIFAIAQLSCYCYYYYLIRLLETEIISDASVRDLLHRLTT